MVLHLLLSPSITLILSEVLINLNLNILIFLFFFIKKGLSMYTGMCIAREQIKGLGIANYDPFFEVHNF